ncbi:hypothetical protein [Luteirhabdus pelagi]|uniref:hypothetical protein n=1 Tax=Luteirhabdus pelagi TaxID=2792783 RepID=UPI00193AB036|nr:hypothetical protein [Luteirhabdus pelagi]
MMKLLAITFLLFCLLTACKEHSSQPRDKDFNTKSEITTSSNHFRIGNSSAGIFKLGDSLPTAAFYHEYSISTKEIVKRSEGSMVTTMVYTVSDDEEELLQLKPSYRNKHIIGEIIILSPLFKTPKGIGVGSDLNSFFKAYPDGILWYTYVSDRFVAETEQLEAQFLLDEDGFTATVSSDEEIIPLKRTTFKPDTEIKRIRLWKVQNYID